MYKKCLLLFFRLTKLNSARIYFKFCMTVENYLKKLKIVEIKF